MPDLLDVHAPVTATEAAEYAGVTVQAVCNWRRRGYLLPDGTRAYLPVARDEHGREIRDAQGRPKYRLIDVAKAERATSKRGRRVA